MATESSAASKSNSSTADSYIGSLISLTSKSEIRYEGVLYNIHTEESSIGLTNVRSFGTEGRKKDGPQVPPGDKIYEYILFRGTDIKDLQVKSSPPVQPTPPINDDPAIIQSHYPRPVATSTSLSSAGTGTLADLGSHNAQMGIPGSNFQGDLPLYQPGGNLGSWGAIPPPPANGGGLAMPMYWQGYYPSNGLPHLHQQSLLRSPLGLAMPPSMQQPMQYPNFNAPLPSGASNPLPFGASNLPGSNMPEVSSSLLSISTSSLNLKPASLPPYTLPSSLPLVPSASLPSETFPSSLLNKARSSTLPITKFGTSLPSLDPLTTSSLELNPIVPPSSSKPTTISVPVLPNQSSSQPTSSIVALSSSIRSETPAPSLVTPVQLLQLVPTTIPSSQTASSSQSAQTAHKDVEVVQVSSLSLEPSAPVAMERQPPIFPLPVSPRGAHKPNGAPFQARYGYRGRERGRGNGNSRPMTKYTEDFDFMAMNEKFKKDEVWGHLGKSNISRSKEDDGQINDGDGSQDEDDAGVPKVEIKPFYDKDGFFDSLSSNSRDYGSQNGRTRFSDQRKLDTECTSLFNGADVWRIFKTSRWTRWSFSRFLLWKGLCLCRKHLCRKVPGAWYAQLSVLGGCLVFRML